MQLSLFPPKEPSRHNFIGCPLLHYPQFISLEKADTYFQRLRQEIDWRQDTIQIYGKKHLIPRLNAWYGEKSYTYSRNVMEARALTPLLLQLQEQLRQAFQLQFNSVLLNLYRDGQDSMGWHADNEPEIAVNQPIASLSFGASRRFLLREKITKGSRISAEKIAFTLSHGDLFIMYPPTQLRTEHALPKTKKVQEPRINLTFRCLR